MSTAPTKAKDGGTNETVQSVINTDPTDAGANNELATAGVGDDAVVIKADEGGAGKHGSETAGETYVTLDKDVVEEFYFPDTKRPSYRLLFTKGQVVPKSAVDLVEANAKEIARRKSGEVDKDNPAGIDSTTLASGTNAHLARSK